jgi:hypothetical protein
LGGSFPCADIGFGGKTQRLEMVEDFLPYLIVGKGDGGGQELLKMLAELVRTRFHSAVCLSVCRAARRIECDLDAARKWVTRILMKKRRQKANIKRQRAKGRHLPFFLFCLRLSLTLLEV